VSVPSGLRDALEDSALQEARDDMRDRAERAERAGYGEAAGTHADLLDVLGGGLSATARLAH
jgi:hypothetical protein